MLPSRALSAGHPCRLGPTASRPASLAGERQREGLLQQDPGYWEGERRRGRGREGREGGEEGGRKGGREGGEEGGRGGGEGGRREGGRRKAGGRERRGMEGGRGVQVMYIGWEGGGEKLGREMTESVCLTSIPPQTYIV